MGRPKGSKNKPKKNVTTKPTPFGKPLLAGRNVIAGNSIGDELINKVGTYGDYGAASEYFESNDIARFPAEVRNPTLNPEQFFLPKFLSNDGSPNIELNTWYDHYYRFHPLIANLISLHSTLPISRFGMVGVEDSKVLQEYEDISEDLKVFETSMEMLKAEFQRGEYLLYARWNDDLNSFSHLKLIDTNYINVIGHYLLMSDTGEEDTELYEYQPDEYLEALVSSENEMEKMLVDEYLDPELREAIENNFSIFLDPFSATFIKRTVNSWDLRGTSILCNIIKTLILEDKLREFQYANAQANTTPIYLWKVGDENHPADDDMLLSYKEIIQALGYDPNKNMITNHLLSLNIQGAVGQTDKMQADFEHIDNKILTALWGNKAFTTSEGMTYNSSSVAMRVLMGRYIPYRTKLENVFYSKVFLPIAIARGYYKSTEKDRPNGKSAMIKTSKSTRDLIIPKFDWRHKQSLMDDANVRSMLISLQEKGKMPMKVICDSLDLDYEYVMKWIEKESNTILDSGYSDIKKVLMNSAAAGTLQDKGDNMMKRVIDAGTSWFNAITGRDSNVKVIEKEKEKEKKKEAKQYSEVQDSNIKYILRKNAKKVEEQLKQPRKFQTVYSSTDLTIKSLQDNYYDNDFINLIKEQLYDLKILTAKAGKEYLMKKKSGVVNEKNPITIQAHVDDILKFNQEEYRKKLYQITHLAVKSVSDYNQKILKESNLNIISNLEKYDLIEKIEELECNEESVLKEYWNTIYPKLQVRSILNMIDVYRRKQIECFNKVGVKEFYINGKKEDVNNFVFEVDDRLIPDYDYKIKKVFRLNKNLSIKLPIELINDIKDLTKKYLLKGNFDFSTEKLNTIGTRLKKEHLGYVYDNMNNYDELTDLEAKYSQGEEDYKEFFINQGMKFLEGKKLNENLEKYFKLIL